MDSLIRTDTKQLFARIQNEFLRISLNDIHYDPRELSKLNSFEENSQFGVKLHFQILNLSTSEFRLKLLENEKAGILLLDHLEESLIQYIGRIGKWETVEFPTEPMTSNALKEAGVYQIFDFDLFGKRFILLDKLCLIIFNHEFWLTSYEDVLSLVDTLSYRNRTLITSRLYQSFDPYECPSPDKIRRLYHLMDQILMRAGNEGYRLLKMHESIWLSRLYELESMKENLKLGLKFAQNVRQEAKEVSQNLGCLEEYSEVEKFVMDQCKETHITQFFGLYRHFGIPMVDGVDGTRKVFENGTTTFITNAAMMSTFSAYVRRSFATRYRKTYGSWPLTDLTDLNAESEIRLAFQHRRDVNLGSSMYSEWDWNHG